MKINWFSPLQPAPTDIAHYTRRVLPAISRRAQVTLWTDQAEWDESVEALARVRRFDPARVDWAELNRADISVYNLGNNPLFHGPAWQVSRAHAGVVVLHDVRLHHFFDGLYRVARRDLDAYLSVMRFYYGEEGARDAADCFAQDARNINEMAEKYPLTEHATENSIGVMVHTHEAFEQLAQNSLRPVAYAPLPFDAGTTTTARDAGEGVEKTDGPPFRLILFGYLSRNRRLNSVLEALAELPEREQFRLDIYGEILDEKRRLLRRVRALGLRGIVTLHGFVKEEELDASLARSHLAINLRHPTMGEASGSQLRIWAHSLPSLVSRTGWYATLSTDAVRIIGIEDEKEEIKAQLRAFLDDPKAFARMGRVGRELLEKFHSPEAYADAVIRLAESALNFRPRAALLKLARGSGALLRDFADSKTSGELLRKVAEEINAMT